MMNQNQNEKLLAYSINVKIDILVILLIYSKSYLFDTYNSCNLKDVLKFDIWKERKCNKD